MPDNEMKPVLSPSIELLRPDGPAAKAAAAFVANVKASFNEAQALASVLCDAKREARALCEGLDPEWRRARARALRRSRRNVETLKREGRCR